MTQTEALRLALEALECLKRDFDAADVEWEIADKAIIAIKAALEAKDEPVALKPCGYESKETKMCRKCGQVHAEAIWDTTPPQRKPLTDEEIRKWWASENGLEDCDMCKIDDFILVAKAIEAKLKEKNT